MVFRDWRSEQAEKERKRVLVVEQRGLQARASAPLLDAVPPTIIGRRLGTVIDHTAHFRDGMVVEWGAAFMEARQLRRDVKARLADVSPGDVTIVYGGLSPVPLTFLAGATLDDDGCAVVLMDWDRFRGVWRPLDGEDDGDRPSGPDLSALRAGADEVSLAISVSYSVDEEAARALDSDVPLLSMRLGNVTVGNHWSEAKQQAIASAFVDAMVQLEAMGVRTVHLFLAAPNSVVFRLGRAYDGRNMPELLVSQYERSDPRRFPWAVRMPHHGEPEPSLVFPPAMA